MVHVYLRLLEEIRLRTFFFFLEDADIFPYEPKFSILMRLHYFQLGFPS